MIGFIKKLFSQASENMNWNPLTSAAELDKIVEESKNQPILILKHSTRCSISSMALNRIERAWNEAEMKGLKPYYLDLIAYRPISNEIAERFGVQHESPQVLVIENGECIYSTSHMGINYQDFKKFSSVSSN